MHSPTPINPELSRTAEAIAREKAATLSGLSDLEPLDEVANPTLHQLRVHQIELEMQNEELRRTQLELEVARARYFDLYDLAPVGYCTLSVQGLILEANFTAATLMGMARSKLVKQPISRFILRQDQDIFYLHRKQFLKLGETQSYELRMVNKEGAQFWANLTVTGAQDDGESVLRVVLRDVTDQKLMEAAILESEERFRTLTEWAPEPIAVHRNGKIIYVNQAAIRMFGARSAGELLDKPILDLVHPDFHATTQGWMESATREGAAKTMLEAKFLKLDAATIEVQVHSTWIAYDGAPAIQVAMHDVTEAKRLNQLLYEKNVELERARSLAEKASLAKSEFLSSMSHELRSPLNAILGFAQLMEMGSPAPTASQRGSIDQILKGGWYLLDLINEILDLALIESGKLSLTLEPVSVAEVLLDCQAMIEPQAQKSGIQISFPQAGNPYFISADRTRLKQVLVNLLTNAIKYNRPNGTVQVSCLAVPPQRLRISVQDGGDGLPADKLAQLFQSFNRLGRESGVQEGTGIGLVVSKRLVELMEGEIGAQSSVGVGSVFWFELNLSTPTLRAAAADEPTASIPIEVRPVEGLRTLLYVEDNQANMQLVEQLVARRPDLHLLSAGDGRRGIELARSHLPDVIVMDINLPGLSGTDALKILRHDPATAHIPVLALSANAMGRDIERGLEAGFFSYLTKPIRVNEFMDALDTALKVAQIRSDGLFTPGGSDGG